MGWWCWKHIKCLVTLCMGVVVDSRDSAESCDIRDRNSPALLWTNWWCGRRCSMNGSVFGRKCVEYRHKTPTDGSPPPRFSSSSMARSPFSLVFLSCSSSSSASFFFFLASSLNVSVWSLFFLADVLHGNGSQVSLLNPTVAQRVHLDQTRRKVPHLILCRLTVSPWQLAQPPGVLWDEGKRILVNSLGADLPVLVRLIWWLVKALTHKHMGILSCFVYQSEEDDRAAFVGRGGTQQQKCWRCKNRCRCYESETHSPRCIFTLSYQTDRHRFDCRVTFALTCRRQRGGGVSGLKGLYFSQASWSSSASHWNSSDGRLPTRDVIQPGNCVFVSNVLGGD